MWLVANRQWPQEPLPHLALGNHAHCGDNLKTAADYFQRGLQFNPQDSTLTTNLASALGELGCLRAGETLLRPVAERQSIDSSWSPVMAATLSELALT